MLKGDLVIYTLIYHHIGTYSNITTVKHHRNMHGETLNERNTLFNRVLDLGNKAHLRGQKLHADLFMTYSTKIYSTLETRNSSRKSEGPKLFL